MSLTWSTLLSFSLSKWASVSRSICFESSLATQIKCNQCPNVPASPRFTSSQAAHSPGAFHWIDKKKSGVSQAHSGYVRSSGSHTQLRRENINSHPCTRNQHVKTRRGLDQRGNSRKRLFRIKMLVSRHVQENMAWINFIYLLWW